MKIGLLVSLVNDRQTGAKRPYHAIRAVAQQVEADGFDSIWLADHLLYRDPGEPTRGMRETWGRRAGPAAVAAGGAQAGCGRRRSWRNPRCVLRASD